MSAKRALTDLQAKEACEMYVAGGRAEEIAAHFSLKCESTIIMCLKRAGIPLRPKNRLSEEQVQAAAVQYAAGVSTLKLGEQLGVSPQTVANEFQARGIELREPGSHRRLSLREDVFDTLTPESLYWMGMLATDGSVCDSDSGSDMVRLALKEEDLAQVQAFRAFLGSGHKISRVAGKHPDDPTIILYRWELKVRSNRLSGVLAQYGIVPRKTYTLAVKGGIENERDFWTGALDGDGHVGIHKSKQGPDATLKLVGASEVFVEQFRSFIRAHGVRGDQNVGAELPSESSLATHTKYNLKLGGAAALDAAALLYVDSTAPVLSRKAHAAADMILRGSRGVLVGTIRESWSNPHAVAWAESQMLKAA